MTCVFLMSYQLGPVVQSIVSLMSSLVVKIFSVLVSTISNSQVVLLENVSSFCKCKSYSHFFSKNICAYDIFLLQQKNARVHTCKVAMDAVERNRYELIPHLAYLPDLAPSDFFLFL